MKLNLVFAALRDGQAIFGGAEDREAGRRFVLEHGKGFTPARLLKGMRRRKAGTCYESSAQFILNHRESDAAGFRYVEGFAMHPFDRKLIGHAWVARDGKAFDLTRQNPFGIDGLDCHYFGVEFPAKALGMILSKRRYYGLLDPVNDLVRNSLADSLSLKEAA